MTDENILNEIEEDINDPENYAGPPELAPKKAILTQEEIETRKLEALESSSYFYVLISGSKTINDKERIDIIYKLIDDELKDIIKADFKKIVIVEGEEKGVDTIAKNYANDRGYTIKGFPAAWSIYGPTAGLKRNQKMHEFISQYPNRLVLCFKDSISNGTGTKDSFNLAKKYQTNAVWYQFTGDQYTRDPYLNRKSRIYKIKDYYGIPTGGNK